MTEIKRQLREWGADPDTAIEHMMNDEKFYRKMLKKFAEEDELCELGIIAREDPKEGFRIAHNLKGTAGTLGLTPLYDAVCDVVEDLRERHARKGSGAVRGSAGAVSEDSRVIKNRDCRSDGYPAVPL